MMDNVIKFPQRVEVRMLWLEEFGVNIDNVEHAKVAGDQVLIWFKYDEENNERAWDIAVQCETANDAQLCLNDFLDSVRRIRMGIIDEEI